MLGLMALPGMLQISQINYDLSGNSPISPCIMGLVPHKIVYS
jgi:hypothetical protein